MWRRSSLPSISEWTWSVQRWLEMLTMVVIRWHQKLVARPVVRKFLDIQAEALNNIPERK